MFDAEVYKQLGERKTIVNEGVRIPLTPSLTKVCTEVARCPAERKGLRQPTSLSFPFVNLMPLLEIKNLQLEFSSDSKAVRAVDGVIDVTAQLDYAIDDSRLPRVHRG